jgi:trk system potassium uptake protein TrkH
VSPGRLRLGPGINWALVVPVVAGVLVAVALGMIACLAVALIGGEGGVAAFGLPLAVVAPLGAGGLVVARRLPSTPIRARDGFLAVTLAWVVAAIFGAAPFLVEGTFTRAVDAFFESMSGFTTTGATLIGILEDQPDAILLWRSISQWLGGVGIVVLVVAIAPAAGLASSRVFYAEMTGVTAERLTPRITETAKIIWAVYLSLSVLGLVAYWVAGMSLWDALNHGMTTVATGGFSTRTASLAAFDSLAIELVAVVLMIAGGINFAFYWMALRGRPLGPQGAEVRAYLLILVGVTAVLSAALLLSDEGLSLLEAVRDAGFTTVSVMTSTGYTTADFDLWHDFARLSLLLLMFVGACAGSTAGGMKVIRVMLLAKTANQEAQRHIQPKAVQVLRVGGRVYGESVRRGVLGFFLLYLLVFGFGVLVMAAIGLDQLTATASVAATLNIVGPALGDVGATENYGAIPESGLWFMSWLMLVGRLEVFTVLVLLTPAFWRRNVA